MPARLNAIRGIAPQVFTAATTVHSAVVSVFQRSARNYPALLPTHLQRAMQRMMRFVPSPAAADSSQLGFERVGPCPAQLRTWPSRGVLARRAQLAVPHRAPSVGVVQVDSSRPKMDAFARFVARGKLELTASATTARQGQNQVQHSPSVLHAQLALSRMAPGAHNVRTTRTHWIEFSAPAQMMECARIRTRLTRLNALSARPVLAARVRLVQMGPSETQTALHASSAHVSTSNCRGAACRVQPVLCLPTYRVRRHASAAAYRAPVRWMLPFMQLLTGQRAPQPSSRAAPASSPISNRLAAFRATRSPTIYTLPPAPCVRLALPGNNLPPT